MLITRKLVMTKDVGCNNNLFGGNMMAWIDEAAAIFAMQYTNESNMVTMKFGEMIFKKPVKVGELIEFLADNIKKGTTSITFDICAYVHDNLVLSVNCIFVCIDENGKKKPIVKFIDWGKI